MTQPAPEEPKGSRLESLKQQQQGKASADFRRYGFIFGGIILVMIVGFVLVRLAQTPPSSPAPASDQSQGTVQALQASLTAAFTTPTLDPQIAALETQNALQAQQLTLAAQQPTQIPQAIIPPTSTPIIPTATPFIVTATSQPATAAPVATVVQPTAVQAQSQDTNALVTFNPGGQSFGQYATDVTRPAGHDIGSCGRVWQATNGENLAWTAIFCNWQISPGNGLTMQWIHPTQATITGTGTIAFELWRDLGASQTIQPDPYTVANQAKSSLGLAWFAQGNNGTICVNTVCIDLTSADVKQIGFPQDFAGHYDIAITVQNGQVQFWQGEKQNTHDDWPIPEAQSSTATQQGQNDASYCPPADNQNVPVPTTVTVTGWAIVHPWWNNGKPSWGQQQQKVLVQSGETVTFLNMMGRVYRYQNTDACGATMQSQLANGPFPLVTVDELVSQGLARRGS